MNQPYAKYFIGGMSITCFEWNIEGNSNTFGSIVRVEEGNLWRVPTERVFYELEAVVGNEAIERL